METKHTPGRWWVNAGARDKNIARVTCDTGTIAECGGKLAEHYANAHYIVQACNNFQALLDVCNALLRATDPQQHPTNVTSIRADAMDLIAKFDKGD